MKTNNDFGEECVFDDSDVGLYQDDDNANIIKALECEKYAKQGDSTAQYHLALRYEKGDGVAQDDDEAEYWYYKSAHQGYVMAQYKLGMRYVHKALYVPDYIDMAIKWLSLAAEQNNAKAQYQLGMIYAAGYCVRKDYGKSFPLLSKAADMGNRDAMYSMGLAYLIGAGVNKDLAQSAEWYRKAAARGMRVANDRYHYVMRKLDYYKGIRK
jgi:TPR repeat protein